MATSCPPLIGCDRDEVIWGLDFGSLPRTECSGRWQTSAVLFVVVRRTGRHQATRIVFSPEFRPERHTVFWDVGLFCCFEGGKWEREEQERRSMDKARFYLISFSKGPEFKERDAIELKCSKVWILPYMQPYAGKRDFHHHPL